MRSTPGWMSWRQLHDSPRSAGSAHYRVVSLPGQAGRNLGREGAETQGRAARDRVPAPVVGRRPPGFISAAPVPVNTSPYLAGEVVNLTLEHRKYPGDPGGPSMIIGT